MTILHTPKEHFDPKLQPISSIGSGCELRAVGVIAVFILLTTVVALTAINLLLGPASSGDLGHMDAKRAEFERSPDEYTAIFLGTSRSMRGINPFVFDAEMSALGCESSSFNFGIPGAPLAEVLHALEIVEREQPPNLKYVFFEPYTVNYRRFRDLLADQRAYFYTWSRLPMFLGDIWSMPGTTRQKVNHLGRFLLAFSFHQISPGRGAERLRPRTLKTGSSGSKLGVNRGYQSLDDSIPRYKARRQYFLARVDQFRKEVAVLRNDPGRRRPSLSRLPILVGVAERIRGLGAEPIVAMLPGTATVEYERDLVKRLAVEEPSLRFVPLNDPNGYPTIFDERYWFDQGHLNSSGADLLSRRLARATCPNSSLARLAKEISD